MVLSLKPYCIIPPTFIAGAGDSIPSRSTTMPLFTGIITSTWKPRVTLVSDLFVFTYRRKLRRKESKKKTYSLNLTVWNLWPNTKNVKAFTNLRIWNPPRFNPFPPVYTDQIVILYCTSVYFFYFIRLNVTRAGSPQQHVHITLHNYYFLDMLILVREKNRSTRRKTLEAQERSTIELNSHEIPHQTWFQWWEAQRANRLRHACYVVPDQLHMALVLVCFRKIVVKVYRYCTKSKSVYADQWLGV